MTTTQDLTVDNFTERTGFRFRLSREQKTQVTAGTLTREQAFQAFLANGGLERLQARNRPEIPDSIYLDPTLTVENFPEKVKAITGVARRFRVSQEQKVRMTAGTLTRAEALAEVVRSKQS